MFRRMEEWLKGLQQGAANPAWDDEAALNQAHRDWLAAREFFNYATDPDLIDYAILNLQAAEKRYIYLWKQARRR